MTTPTPTRLTARTPEDLLAMVPVALGFHPEDSIVLLTFAADHPFHARVDLPGRPADDAGTVEMLLAPARHHRVARAALVVYAGVGRAADARRVGRRLVRSLRSAGVDVVEALLADGHRWSPLLVAGRPGVPYDLSTHPFTAQAVLDGRPLLRSRGELAAGLAPDPAGVAAVGEVLRGSVPPLDAAGVAGLVDDRLGAGRFPDGELAAVLTAIRVPTVRDGAWTPIRRTAARDHVRLWVDAVRRAPEDVRGSAAAVLAFAAWSAGDGALAWCAVDRSVEVDPGNSLAALVADLLHAAVPPAAFEEAQVGRP